MGRAGRFGITAEGHSYLVADNPNEHNLLVPRYLFGRTREVKSSIPEFADIGTVALAVLAMGTTADETDLRDSICRSFAYTNCFESNDERDSFLTEFMESLAELRSNGLIRIDSDGLTVTDLGRVASSSGVSLNTFYALLNILNEFEINCENVAQVIPALCDLNEFQSLRPYDADARSNVLCEWIDGSPTSRIIDDYSTGYELGLGNIRSLGDTAAWMLNTAASIATVPDKFSEGEATSRCLTDLAQQCKFGVPASIVSLAELRVLHRSELNRLIDNSVGKVLDSADKVLDTPLNEFVGILSPQRAEQLQTAILDRIGESLSSRRFGHVMRADKIPGLRQHVEKCYELGGTDFETALKELLDEYFPYLKTNQFGKQRTGQPDLEATGSCGTIVIQATASEGDSKPVSWSKAREVITSVGFSGQASNFVTIARPGFHEVAIGNANEIANRGDPRLLLISIPEFIELCLTEIEGDIQTGSLRDILERCRGHLGFEESADLLRDIQKRQASDSC